ncbi:hypothetical protein [Roseibium algae]|uniref:Uncharacterized protein n=1 Tax=Roseibium algae TaxID=3123038 RepID=A0ABU8TN81_9HYPH
MSIMDDPEIKRILASATVLTRHQREIAIEREIVMLNGADVLQQALQNALNIEQLQEVEDQDFDLAALICWKIIYKLRDGSSVKEASLH